MVLFRYNKETTNNSYSEWFGAFVTSVSLFPRAWLVAGIFLMKKWKHYLSSIHVVWVRG